MAIVSAVTARQFGTMSGNTFTPSSTATKAEDFETSILNAVKSEYDSTETSANGHKSYVAIRRSDDASNNDYEIALATWNTGGTMTLAATRYQTSTGATVTWGGTVVVNGIVSPAGTHAGDSRILQMPFFEGTGDFGAFTTDHNTTSYVAASANYITVTPKSTLSSLRVTATYGVMTEMDGTSGNNIRSRIAHYYEDSGGSDVEIGSTMDFGPFSMPTSDTNHGTRDSVTLITNLTQSELNGSDVWKIAPWFRTVDSDVFVTLLSASMSVQEYIEGE